MNPSVLRFLHSQSSFPCGSFTFNCVLINANQSFGLTRAAAQFQSPNSSARPFFRPSPSPSPSSSSDPRFFVVVVVWPDAAAFPSVPSMSRVVGRQAGREKERQSISFFGATSRTRCTVLCFGGVFNFVCAVMNKRSNKRSKGGKRAFVLYGFDWTNHGSVVVLVHSPHQKP